jgi:hypothetical protein
MFVVVVGPTEEEYYFEITIDYTSYLFKHSGRCASNIKFGLSLLPLYLAPINLTIMRSVVNWINLINIFLDKLKNIIFLKYTYIYIYINQSKLIHAKLYKK